MEKLVRPSRGTRYIGISNFSPIQLNDILRIATIAPKAAQFETHPYLPQTAYIATHQAKNISVIAYSPLANTNPVYATPAMGTVGVGSPPILQNSVVGDVAKRRGCTAAQVVLRWNLERGVIVIPKAAREDHREENYGTVGKCRFGEGDMEKLGNVGFKIRMNTFPCREMGGGCFTGLEGV
jgi:alcohol dehydrogenase (NADP+)